MNQKKMFLATKSVETSFHFYVTFFIHSGCALMLSFFIPCIILFHGFLFALIVLLCLCAMCQMCELAQVLLEAHL